MGRQTYGDESNYKHEPNSEHHIDDKFGKGTRKRSWKQNIDETLSSEQKTIKAPNQERTKGKQN